MITFQPHINPAGKLSFLMYYILNLCSFKIKREKEKKFKIIKIRVLPS